MDEFEQWFQQYKDRPDQPGRIDDAKEMLKELWAYRQEQIKQLEEKVEKHIGQYDNRSI